MTHVVAERLEVRLDSEHRRRLAEIAAERGTTLSEIVRQMIDQTYEETRRAGRLRAAREIAAMGVEDVPDLESLRRQLEGTYESPDLS